MGYCAVIMLCLINLLLAQSRDLLVLTVATEANDALERFLRSAQHNEFNVKILGFGEPWKGGDLSRYTGGGQKINLLKNALQKYSEEDILILFVDSYDVVFMDSKSRLLEEYEKSNYTVLFGAEGFCWPDESLKKKYPQVGPGEQRFLNSGGFIGPASHLYRIVTEKKVDDKDDDQLYYTNIFLNVALREKLNIGLDKKSAIFQNLHGAFADVELRFKHVTGYLVNTKTNTTPIVAHGNGPIKPEFNSLTNYLDHNWTPTLGCQHCNEKKIYLNKQEEFPTINLSIFIEQPKSFMDMFFEQIDELSNSKININMTGQFEDYPTIQLSIFIQKPTPFLDVFFDRIAALSYPKSHIHLTGYVSPTAENQVPLAEVFHERHGHKYRSVTWFVPEVGTDEGSSWDMAYAHCLARDSCQFLFAVDSTVQLTYPGTIEHLIQMNRSMITPMLSRRGQWWSNFWGALSPGGDYERSYDYIDIVERRKIGIWNVPFVRDVFLLSRRVVDKFAKHNLTGVENIDMRIPAIAREENVFMIVDNQEQYGYLTFAESYTTEHLHNDLWQIFDNPLDWEEQYIHPDYFQLLAPEVGMKDIEQPCPDVFYFPITSEKFCRQLIAELEAFGQWSDGSNTDPRLEGGYENVPTRDIHMRQINWEEHWLHFLVKYIHPIQKKAFEGYDTAPWARMNFVVRYRPEEQASLRPHHDAATYTITIALNEWQTEYQGGGTSFVRYNCSLVGQKLGWTSMFPGGITHLHEGLETTFGTRYIFVTFINP